MAIFLMHEVRWHPGSAARSYRNLPKHCASVTFPPALTNRPSSSERTTHRENPKYRDSLALPPDLPRGQSDPERAILRENPKHGDSLALHPDLPRGRSYPERAILRENPKRSVVFERTPWHVLRAPIVPGRIYWILPKRSRMSRRTFRENPKYWHRNQPSLRKAPMRTAILPPHRSSSEPSFRKFPIRLAIRRGHRSSSDHSSPERRECFGFFLCVQSASKRPHTTMRKTEPLRRGHFG